MHRLLALIFLFSSVLAGKPVLEVYEIGPKKGFHEPRLVLKITNPDEKDYFVHAEKITEIPYFIRFTQNKETFDIASLDCGAGSRPLRLRAKTYALIEVRMLPEVLFSIPVGIRSSLFSDEDCHEVVWTNELKFTPKNFEEKKEPKCDSETLNP